MFVCNRGDTTECHDGLRTRELGQSPMNVSAAYGNVADCVFVTMDVVVSLDQLTTQPFLDLERTG